MKFSSFFFFFFFSSTLKLHFSEEYFENFTKIQKNITIIHENSKI